MSAADTVVPPTMFPFDETQALNEGKTPVRRRMFKTKELIVDEDAQVRVDISANAEKLAPSIKQDGLQFVPKVYLDRQGRPHLFQGMTRGVSCRDVLKMEEIECDVWPVEPRDAIMLTMTENLVRENYSPLEEGRIFQAAINRGWNEKQIAVKQHLSPKHIEQCLAVLKLPEKGQMLVHKGRLGLEAASRLADAPEPVRQHLSKEWTQDHDRIHFSNAAHQINHAVQEYEENLKVEELLKDAKHPKCPTCKKQARSLSRQRQGFVCCNEYSGYDEKHNWNPKTGQTLADVLAKEHPRNYRIDEKGRAQKPRIIVRAYRSPIPLEILNRAMMAYAIEQGHKLLRQNPGGNISIQVGGKHIQIETGSDTLRYSTWNWGGNDQGLVIEKKNYGDKAGNITKITPNYFGQKQTDADRAKRQTQSFLDGLDAVAQYRKKMKNQRPLTGLTKPRKAKKK